MKKTNNKYLLFGLIGVIVIGAVVVLSQNAGQLMQGDLIRSVSTTTYPVSTADTISTTSYTVPDDTKLALARIEDKLNTITTQLQTQNTKIDNLTNGLNKFRTKVNVFAKEMGSMLVGICSSSNNTIYANCSTSYMRIQVESAVI